MDEIGCVMPVDGNPGFVLAGPNGKIHQLPVRDWVTSIRITLAIELHVLEGEHRMGERWTVLAPWFIYTGWPKDQYT